ncbi:MAG: hypothetical protein KGV44_14835 [Flavobacteriaceae bacterium]|nr:hypothetical protein [Flavobacteriaceae bacterium]
MNTVAKLFIDRQEWELNNTNIEYYRNIRWNGKPCSYTMGGIVNISFTPKGSEDDILCWMFANRYDNENLDDWRRHYKLKNVEIVFYEGDFNGRSLFKYKLEDCTCVRYFEVFNNLWGMETFVTLSAAIQYYKNNDFYLIKGWRENWKPPQPYQTPVVEFKDTTPRITFIDWINQEKQIITDTTYNTKVGLKIDLVNPNGGKVLVKIKKKDGSKFDDNTEEITFEETASSNSLFIRNLEIKEHWEDFKSAKIDELVATATYMDSSKQSKPLKITPTLKIIVDFRPSKNYKGEYGFDYMRDQTKGDKLTYKTILKSGNYTDLVKEYGTLTFDWYKDKAGKKIEYLQSWLTIYPQQTVTLSLQIETIENLNEKDLYLEYDCNYFHINNDVIPAQGKSAGKTRLNDFLKLECLKEFSTDQTIKVMYEKRQLGQLNILANAKSKRKKVDVVFVKVETDIKGKGKPKIGNATGKKAFLTRYLQQALITPNIVVESLDLTTDKTFNQKFAGKGYIDNKKGIHNYLNSKMDNKYS